MFNQENLKKLGLKTGDILLFSCNYLPGRVVHEVTDSKWTHIGMIIVNESDGTVKLFESTITSLGAGVQINPLDKALENAYKTQDVRELAIRRLAKPLSPEQKTILDEFVKSNLGKLYERKFLEFFNAVCIGPNPPNEEVREIAKEIFGGRASQDSFSCSELVAAAFQAMGLITTNCAANSFIPEDFSSSGSRTEFINDLFLPEEPLNDSEESKGLFISYKQPKNTDDLSPVDVMAQPLPASKSPPTDKKSKRCCTLM